MENASSNRLSSAKWSRNLNEDSQTESNRLRLLERQRQLLETKLQRRQHQSASSGVVSSRPATSGSGIRARVSRQASSDVLLDASLAHSDDAIIGDVEEHAASGHSPHTAVPRARTSVAGNRKLTSLDSSSSPNSAAKSPSRNGQMGTSLASNVSSSANKPPASARSNLRDLRSVSRSEANLSAAHSDSLRAKLTGPDLIGPNPLTTILSDEELLNFVTQPISPEVTLQCTIIRDKKGLDRSLYPTYYMHLQDIIINQPGGAVSGESAIGLKTNAVGLEGTATISMSESVDSLESIKSNEDDSATPTRNGQKTQTAQSQNGGGGKSSNASTASNNSNRKVFVLSGRRRKKSKTYLIGNNAFDISRDRCLAKLKSNVLGTQFTAIRLQQNGVRHEIASISYETNVLGFKGPRKMAILMPKIDEKTNVICNLSLQEEYRRNSRAILLLKNKTPIWNEETQSYVLNFHGRVTQASVKNFQLVVADIASQGRPKTGLSEMRRSASSHQLRQRFTGSDSGMDSASNDQMDDDDDEEEDEGEDSDNEKNNARNQPFASTRPMSKSLSKSGYLSASNSEDAKNMVADPNELVSLQFGRVSNTQFSCDVSWPLSLLQAFAIALSSFDSKLACE